MLAPNFVLAKVEGGILYYANMDIDNDKIIWSINTAFVWSSLATIVEFAQIMELKNVDIKSINFVGKIHRGII